MFNLFKRLQFTSKILMTAAPLLTLLASPALSAPVLRSDIIVNAGIVTVGDMFEQPGSLSDQALFRAPAPGTAGQVDLSAIRIAAARAGLDVFDNPGFAQVRVARAGTMVTEQTLTVLIEDELRRQGILSPAMSAHLTLNNPIGTLYAAIDATSDAAGHIVPTVLEQLSYLPGNERFSARFMLAGNVQALNLTGTLTISVEAPHLRHSVPSGTILQNTDLDMRPIALELANSMGVASIEDLIGQQVKRRLREGVVIRANDVANPIIVARNDEVTLLLQTGRMTLTVKGKALNDASRGEIVSVLNLLSNRVVSGTAAAPGTVVVSTANTTIAAI